MKADTASDPNTTPARRTQKEATRQRVLAAARELFDTHGYQGTTIREIARHAGVAVGSVFTTFASKGEILSEVMQARLDPLYAEFDRVLPHLRGSTADRLRTLFSVFVEFEAQHLRLFLAHIAAAYDWTLTPEARPFGRAVRLQAILRDCVLKGVEAGDVSPDIDPEQVVHQLKAVYAWSYSFVVSDGAGAAEQIAFMDRQIGLIADGFRPR
jgi:AcrR family transcriptional regulator